MEQILTKTKYISGLQCSKLLWYHYNDPHKIPPQDGMTKYIFDQGHNIGVLAQGLFPNGIIVKNETDHTKASKLSFELLRERRPLFEAGFKYENIYARADILNPVNDDAWDIIEVKSSTKIDEISLHDISFQKHCFEKAGLKIRNCYVMFINKYYIKHGEIDLKELFTIKNVTSRIRITIKGIKKRIKKMLDIIKIPSPPEKEIGHHCRYPYKCLLQNKCMRFLPEKNIYSLCRIRKSVADSLVKSGIYTFKEIPDEILLTARQIIQINCEETGEPYIDKEDIRSFLSKLIFPQYFLDFETFMTSVPVFDETHPYQQIPFQFSLHVLESSNAKPLHYSFISDCLKDPRKDILLKLKKLLGDEGSIIAYNVGFEIGVLKRSSEVFPEYIDWFNKIRPRFIDLWEPFRNFDYYSPLQNGSASLKKVLPALTKKNYDNMAINNGEAACSEFMRVTFSNVSKKEKQKVLVDLEKYCSLDTMALIDILFALQKLVR